MISLVKITILILACYTLYNRISEFSLPIPDLTFLSVVVLVIFSLTNWSLEILKWKQLASSISYIPYSLAIEQSLAAHTAAIITPNKIGEYGIKASYFKKKTRKKVLGLTFVGNAYQLIITILFGCIGLFLFDKKIVHSQYFLVGFPLLVIFGLYIFKKKKSFYFFNKLKTHTHFKVFTISLLRYLVFSLQYIYVLNSLNIQTDTATLLPFIWLIYFISSCIPSFAIFDFAIKGSVALYVFSDLNISNEIILTTAFIMWVFNFMIPAVIGGYYIVKFNSKQQFGYDSI